MKALILGAAWSLLAAQEPLSYDDLLARLRPGAEVLQAEALIAGQARDLAASRGLLREGPTLSAAAGPRTGERRSTDRSLELELPLFLRPGLRRDASRAFEAASPLLRAGARLEARRRLRQAYLDAWMEAETLALRRADLSTLEVWHRAAKARVEAGADPAFQASLVAGERLRAQEELEEALRRRVEAWGRLRLQVDLPETIQGLRDPGAPVLPAAEGAEAAFRGGVLWRLLEACGVLERGRLRLEEAQALSRWSLRGEHAREGEESVTRLGLAVRLPRPGETRLARQAREAQERVVAQATQAEALELEARFQSLQSRLEALRAQPLSVDADLDGALKAVDLRLQEGRERPSEALPIRRQLLEARMAQVRRAHAVHSLLAELEILTAGALP